MKLEFSWQIFEESSNVKFNENLSSGSRVITCGLAGGQTDLTKLVVAFRNFANAPRKNTKNSETLFVGDGSQLFADFRFSRGTLESNPCEKWEVIMSAIVGRETTNALKIALDLIEILNLTPPKYKAYVWTVWATLWWRKVG